MAHDSRQADIRHGGGFRPQAVEIKPCPEEQQPGQQREVVRGDEAGGGEAQSGGERVCIPVPGQIQKRDTGKAEKAACSHPAAPETAAKLQGQPRTGRDAGLAAAGAGWSAGRPSPRKVSTPNCTGVFRQHQPALPATRRRRRKSSSAPGAGDGAPSASRSRTGE